MRKRKENDVEKAYKDIRPAYLILADGTVFKGRNMGVAGTTIGEVVFTTGMTGYQETLTDPSFYGQMVTQTFPLIGNYGINSEDKESSRVWVSGYIVREVCFEPSNFRCEKTMESYLEENEIIGIYDIDTRALTKKIRETGVMNGAITTEWPEDMDALLKEINAFTIKDAVASVSYDEPMTFTIDDPVCKVVLMDYGYKKNILRSLNQRGCEVIVMPHDTTLEQIKKIDPDGIMLSNGPGDPEENKEIIANLKEILDKSEYPVLGICLGHQLMALANGAKTEKLKFGHRGGNQPVFDLNKNRIFVTTQNHGYAVVSDSITPDIGKVSHYNANDKSCEGVIYNRPATFTVQFHPEACAGPHDTQYLFDNFVSNMIKYKGEK
ncbi:MAG: carbamoyl phosphate synthase small subunit [Firmicutes bacterium]|nr:carbamoyl phosphate synthase small subunit [Bacillota bacterium]